MSVNDILNEREKTHGDFRKTSEIWDELKKCILRPYAPGLTKEHFAALEMICLKIARIVNGDPNHADHWDDIAGYAMLGRGKDKPKLSSEDFWCSGCNNQINGTWPHAQITTIGPIFNCDECFKKMAVENACGAPREEESASSKMEHMLCDYDPSNCETCEYHMTPWSNKTWKMHNKSPIKKERCKACKSKSCCSEECPLFPPLHSEQ